MSRKLFISFLGTGIYNECEYVKDDFSFRGRFVQEATLRYLTSLEEWTPDDRIFILLTADAEEKNWVDDGQKDSKTGEIIKAEGLKTRLDTIGCPAPVEAIRNLPDGKDEDEINQLFEAVFNCIGEGDHLYFDLTHGFRYLPMLILVLGNYAKFLKDVTIKSITYGNWEMSAKGTKPAPIIDLMSLSVLQDWTYAAGKIIESGDASGVIDLAKNEYRPVLKATRVSVISRTSR